MRQVTRYDITKNQDYKPSKPDAYLDEPNCHSSIFVTSLPSRSHRLPQKGLFDSTPEICLTAHGSPVASPVEPKFQHQIIALDGILPLRPRSPPSGLSLLEARKTPMSRQPLMNPPQSISVTLIRNPYTHSIVHYIACYPLSCLYLQPSLCKS